MISRCSSNVPMPCRRWSGATSSWPALHSVPDSSWAYPTSFSPSLTPPDLPHTVNIDSNTYEAIPGVDASRRYITPRLVLQELSELQPTTRFSYDNQDLPFTGDHEAAHEHPGASRRPEP